MMILLIRLIFLFSYYNLPGKGNVSKQLVDPIL